MNKKDPKTPSLQGPEHDLPGGVRRGGLPAGDLYADDAVAVRRAELLAELQSGAVEAQNAQSAVLKAGEHKCVAVAAERRDALRELLFGEDLPALQVQNGDFAPLGQRVAAAQRRGVADGALREELRRADARARGERAAVEGEAGDLVAGAENARNGRRVLPGGAQKAPRARVPQPHVAPRAAGGHQMLFSPEGGHAGAVRSF